MPRKAADAAAGELVAALMAGVERVAAEKVTAQMEELAGKVLEHLPELIYLPPPPADVPEERLLRASGRSPAFWGVPRQP